MVTARFFGEARTKLGTAEFTADVSDVNELLKAISVNFEVLDVKSLKNFLIYVNGEPINRLKMFRTKLKDGDTVLLLSPVSGG